MPVIINVWAFNDRHGFDVTGTLARLDTWCLEHFACPAPRDHHRRSGGLSDGVRDLLIDHWGTHGVHRVVKERGGKLVSASRCFAAPCLALGVALAVMEVYSYEGALAELDELDWLKQAQHRFSIPESIRAELLAHASELAANPVLPVVTKQGAGRRRRPLAQAMAQHLWKGGFSHQQIAKFMGCSAEVIRRRCKVRGVRSLTGLVSTNGADSELVEVRSR